MKLVYAVSMIVLFTNLISDIDAVSIMVLYIVKLSSLGIIVVICYVLYIDW